MSTQTKIAPRPRNGAKPTATALKLIRPTDKKNSATSRQQAHFAFLADCVLAKHESRPHFFKILDSLLAEFQPATFMESHLVGTLAVYRWRQLRSCGMYITAIASSHPGRASALALLDRHERHCKRQFNRTRKCLLEVISRRVNNAGASTRTQPLPAA